MFSGYFLGYFFRTIKILEKSKDLQIDHQASFLMLLSEIKVEKNFRTIHFYTLNSINSNNSMVNLENLQKYNRIVFLRSIDSKLVFYF